MRGRDREEFRSYVRLRSATLLRTAYLLTGSRAEAEDLLQEALVRLHRAWPRLREPAATDAYVRRTMVNLRTTAWRRRKLDTVPMSYADDVPAPDGAHERAERDAMWAALATLPPRMRAVLVLRFYEDLTEAQVAEFLSCSVGTVKSQSSRALAKLRELFPEEAPSC